MFVFPIMLVSAAKQAGIKVPDDPDNYNPEAFIHWHVYCLVQLECPMYPGEHFENAKAISSIPEYRIKSASIQDLIDAGYHSKALE